MTILKNLKFAPILFQYDAFMNQFYFIFFFQIAHPKWLPSTVTKSSKNMQYLMNNQINLDQICVKLMRSLSSQCEGPKQVRYSVPRKYCNTVDFLWLEHIWNHENMFETGVVRANEC